MVKDNYDKAIEKMLDIADMEYPMNEKERTHFKSIILKAWSSFVSDCENVDDSKFH